MPATTDRLEFAPPPQPALIRAALLAVIAHLLLLGALTWGVNWKRQTDNIAVEAELWSQVPQAAAPRPVEPSPAPPAEPRQAEPVARDADIAMERERRKRLEQDRDRRAEEERERRAELRRQRDAEQRELARRAEDKRKAEAAVKARDAASAQKLARQAEVDRQAQLRRIQGLAGATGSPDSAGTAARASAPSANYAGRIAALIKRSVRYSDVVAGNPTVDVEVRSAPDGTIIGQRVVKSSGNKAWDDAVIRGIISAERLPRNEDGLVPAVLIIGVRQNE